MYPTLQRHLGAGWGRFPGLELLRAGRPSALPLPLLCPQMGRGDVARWKDAQILGEAADPFPAPSSPRPTPIPLLTTPPYSQTAANSWGPAWGERGHFRIVRGVNECDIESFVLGVWGRVGMEDMGHH